MKRSIAFVLLLASGGSALLTTSCAGMPGAARAGPTVYVVVWMDTEDYLLPADDDATLRICDFLSAEGLRGTFKLVGEKARVMEKRGRTDVIAALKRHEIGYHSDFHSVHPTPAQYLSTLGWDEGVAEFERREGPGVRDLRRIFGVNPTTYGQPGSSWGPQSFGALKNWGMTSYLDYGTHVSVDGKPHYYAGLLMMFHLTHTLRTGLGGPQDVEVAKEKFRKSRDQLLAEGGGLVSIFYHPCEFVHQRFWDAIFAKGVNPPREEWTPPPQKTPEQSKAAFESFETWIRYLKTFPDVRFITASEAARLYADTARAQVFDARQLKEIAAAVGEEINYQRRGTCVLAPSEIFALLTGTVNASASALSVGETPLGPTDPVAPMAQPVTVSWSQFARTAKEVDAFLKKHGRIPPTIWLGTAGVPPEAWLAAVARAVPAILDGKPPATVEFRPARLATEKHVAQDSVKLWGWLFAEGFSAPRMMELARRQAWTIKPAVLHD